MVGGVPVVVKSLDTVSCTLKTSKSWAAGHIDADNFIYVQFRQIPKVTAESLPCSASNGMPYMVVR